jgi:ribose/xylose/arabinose/galactoside ABC-type transport system permease subunit
MEGLVAWAKGLPSFLANFLDILLIAIIFVTAFTLLIGIWLGFLITRKRMNHIVELQFFPPKITFKEKS